MIKILKEEKRISISGHSNYDEEGRDIVCSAVSSIMITTINAIGKFNSESISYSRNNNTSVIKLLGNDIITMKLLDNMMELFYELERKYPKNIQVKER